MENLTYLTYYLTLLPEKTTGYSRHYPIELENGLG